MVRKKDYLKSIQTLISFGQNKSAIYLVEMLKAWKKSLVLAKKMDYKAANQIKRATQLQEDMVSRRVWWSTCWLGTNLHQSLDGSKNPSDKAKSLFPVGVCLWL